MSAVLGLALWIFLGVLAVGALLAIANTVYRRAFEPFESGDATKDRVSE